MGWVLRCGLAVGMVAGAIATAAACVSPARVEAAEGAARGQVHVGAVAGTKAYIALVVRGRRVTGYLCDGRKLSVWFTRSRAGLVSRDGRVIGQLSRLRGPVRGEIEIDGAARTFTARSARGDAGLYRAAVAKRRVAAEAGWIVLANGTQRGTVKLASLETVTRDPAPTLSPTAKQISLGTGIGVAPVTEVTSPTLTASATLSPKSVAFVDTPVGTQSAPRTVVLTATGTASVKIARVSVTNSDFVVTGGTCQPGAVVRPLESCSSTVAFTPRALGSRAAELVFSDDAGGASRVPLSGEGVRLGSQAPSQPLLTITPASLLFPTTRLAGETSRRTLTLTASGNTAINLMQFSLVGTNPGDFVITGTTCAPPFTLPVGTGCTVEVAFAPRTSEGQRTAVLKLENTALGSPHLVRLDGTATR